MSLSSNKQHYVNQQLKGRSGTLLRTIYVTDFSEWCAFAVLIHLLAVRLTINCQLKSESSICA
jgi:hypothetical protein